MLRTRALRENYSQLKPFAQALIMMTDGGNAHILKKEPQGLSLAWVCIFFGVWKMRCGPFVSPVSRLPNGSSAKNRCTQFYVTSPAIGGGRKLVFTGTIGSALRINLSLLRTLKHTTASRVSAEREVIFMSIFYFFLNSIIDLLISLLAKERKN